MPLILSLASAVLLILGLGGYAPQFFNSGGVSVLLFLALSAFCLSVGQEVKYKRYTQIVSAGVMCCVVYLMVGSFFWSSSWLEEEKKLLEQHEFKAKALAAWQASEMQKNKK